jgi:outer membrane biosynthesis protein TonB
VRDAVIFSAILHLAAVALAYFGLPRLFDAELSDERVLIVELVAVAEERNLPDQIEPEPEAVEPEAVAPPPPPPPAARPEPPSAAAPVPEPEPAPTRTAMLPDEVGRPQKKPKPPKSADPFASVLKSVEQLEDTPAPDPEPEPTATPPAPDPVEEVLARANTGFTPEQPLSMSEKDNIKYQIQRNWSLPAGARDAQSMRVTLRIQLAPDGSVIDVTVVNQGQMRTDPFFRAMAESTVRAVLKTKRIKNLSPEKYDQWRDMMINFDPKDMFG